METTTESVYKTFIVRNYWYLEENPDETTITKDQIKARNLDEAYENYKTEDRSGDWVFLNWLIIEN